MTVLCGKKLSGAAAGRHIQVIQGTVGDFSESRCRNRAPVVVFLGFVHDEQDDHPGFFGRSKPENNRFTRLWPGESIILG